MLNPQVLLFFPGGVLPQETLLPLGGGWEKEAKLKTYLLFYKHYSPYLKKKKSTS